MVYRVVDGRQQTGHARMAEEARYVVLANGARVLATQLTSWIAELEGILEQKNGQRLLRALRLVAQGRVEEADAACVRILRKMDVLDESGIPPPGFSDVVLAAVKGKFPRYCVQEEPYEHTSANEAAMEWAYGLLSEAMGLRYPRDCDARQGGSQDQGGPGPKGRRR